MSVVWRKVRVRDELTGEEREEERPHVKCSVCGHWIDIIAEPHYIVKGRIVCSKCYKPPQARPRGERT